MSSCLLPIIAILVACAQAYGEQEVPPVALPLTEPDVKATEGGDITLRCLFHSNPPPKVTWKKGETSIDGNVGRYLVKSDGALQIVSLHSNDTGVYNCIAHNGLSIASQQIKLIVAGDETNEVTPDCSRYEAECERLRCATGIEHMQTADGCHRCQCSPPNIDCEPYAEACDRLNCFYGLGKTMGHDGCERCACVDPCAPGLVACNVGERCIVVPYRDPHSEGLKYSPECRAVTKPGLCPTDDLFSNDDCNDDADCRGNGKCCKKTCLEPAESTPAPVITTTHTPDMPAPLRTLPLQEPNLSVAEGGKATLHCVFQSNPPPKIAWRRGEITINGNVGRYRLTSNGALEIVSLYRNDTGVYICVADNGLVTAKQKINLIVTVPVSAHVSTTYNTLNIGTEMHLACEVDGYPEPTVYWTKDGQRLEPDDRTSITGNTISRLAISRVTVSDSGLYGCHVDNGYSSHSDNAQINVQQLTVPTKCTDNPLFGNCDLIVRNRFCNHKYYSKFCCKSCVEAGQLNPQLAEVQADQPYRKK